MDDADPDPSHGSISGHGGSVSGRSCFGSRATGASGRFTKGGEGADLVVRIADAKARLSEPIQRAESGERVVIARGNRAVVEPRPLAAVRSPIGIYQEIAGPLDMDALHAAPDEGCSEQDLDDMEGDLDRELCR